MDFALARGKLFHGTVVDADDPPADRRRQRCLPAKAGEPEPPQRSGIPQPRPDRRQWPVHNRRPRRQGHLLVEEGSLDYIRGTISGKEAGTNGTLYPHGFATVDVAAGAEPVPVEIALRKGKTLEARVLGPDGRPLPSVTAWCPELTYRQLDHCQLPDLVRRGPVQTPRRRARATYRVFFLQKELGLAAVAKLTLAPKPDGPLEVKLQPTATVKGVAVNKDGTPALGVQVYPFIVLTEDVAPLKDRDFYDRGQGGALRQHDPGHVRVPKTAAEFTFTNLIPGVRYYVRIARTGGTTREVPAPKPGEVIDLGKIVVEDKRPQ